MCHTKLKIFFHWFSILLKTLSLENALILVIFPFPLIHPKNTVFGTGGPKFEKFGINMVYPKNFIFGTG